jgi:hypothetical protein
MSKKLDIKIIRRQAQGLPGIRLDLRSGQLTIDGKPARAGDYRRFKIVSKTRARAAQRDVLVEVFLPKQGKPFRRVSVKHLGKKSVWCDLAVEAGEGGKP